MHKYINIKAKKEHGTYGYNQCFGSGLARNCYWNFENCTFKSDMAEIWTCHTTTSQATDVSNIVFNNCIFANIDETNMKNTDSIQFLSYSASSHLSELNNVNINSCYVTGKIAFVGGGDDPSAPVTQRYKLTELKTTSNGLRIDSSITTNPYEPEIYN